MEDAALRLRPRISLETGKTVLTGWARSCLPLSGFRVTEISKPNLGETRPAYVVGEASRPPPFSSPHPPLPIPPFPSSSRVVRPLWSPPPAPFPPPRV